MTVFSPRQFLVMSVLAVAGCQDKPSPVTTTPADGEAEIRANLARLAPEDQRLAEQQKYCPLMEEVRLANGVMRNASFTDYLLPTILDMPPVVVDLIEHPHPDAPYGAKGVGEPPTISSTPAIVAAIRAATGRPLVRTPVRPDDIVFAAAPAGSGGSGWVIEPGADPRTARR